MKRSLSLNLTNESGIGVELPDDVPLSQIVPRIKQHMASQSDKGGEYLIFVSRLVDNLDQTLSELGIGDGDAIHLVRVDAGTDEARLQLYLPRTEEPFCDVRPPVAILGRQDGSMPDVQLDIDVSALLPEKRQARVSRRQLQFYIDDGEWFVALHKLASAPAFVGTRRLNQDQPINLSDGNVIAIGASPDQPELQFIVRLEGI